LRAVLAYLADENDPQPVGVRVVEPPPHTKQGVRGNLYAVVELTGQKADIVGLSEQALSALQRTYYTVKGGQSAVLIEAFQQARQVVEAYNAGHPNAPVRAHIGCAALLRRRLLVACDGAAFALVRQGSKVELAPSDPAIGELAAAGAREPEVLRWELEAGDAALLAGPGWGDRVPMRTLASTIAYIHPTNLEDAAIGLLEAGAGVQAPGLLIFFEETTSAPPMRPAFLSAPSQQRAGALGLPTALGAAPPVSNPLPSTAAPPPQPVAQNTTPESADQAQDAGQESGNVTPPVSASRTGQMLEGAKSGLERARNLALVMLPEKRAERSLAQEDEVPLSEDANAAVVAQASVASAASAPTFTPPPPSRGGRARLFVGMALLLLILVPVIVLAVYWQQGVSNRADAESLITLAQARVVAAQDALDAGDPASARMGLSEAKEYLESAQERVGRTAAIDELTLTIERILQDVAQVQPLYGLTSPLVAFPDGAGPTQVMVIDQNIFVLDPARRLVERYQLDQSLEFVPNPVSDVVLREGDVIDGAQVGPLLDMAWQSPVTGFQDRSALLVLDDSNQVFRFDPRVDGASKLDLAEQTDWQDVRQIEMYQGRLYAADVGRSQVYRYEPGQYAAPPTAWFAQPVDLSDMRNMRIDGEIWLLLESGQVLRYFQGEQVPFSLDSSVGLIQQAVDFVVGDATNPFIYLADRPGERVWVYDKNGSYVQQLAAAEGEPLKGLSALFIEDVTDNIYLLTDLSLYKHPLPSN
jgi:hypothetical protein